MKAIFLFTAIIFGIVVNDINAQNTTVSKSAVAPYQGSKQFCSYTHSSTYTITIKGINAQIVYSYNEDTKTIKAL